VKGAGRKVQGRKNWVQGSVCNGRRKNGEGGRAKGGRGKRHKRESIGIRFRV